MQPDRPGRARPKPSAERLGAASTHTWNDDAIDAVLRAAARTERERPALDDDEIDAWASGALSDEALRQFERRFAGVAHDERARALTRVGKARRRSKRGLWALGVSALAAAAAVVALLPAGGGPHGYELATLGSVAIAQDEAGALPLRATRDTELTIHLRPRQAQAAPDVAVFARCTGDATRVPAEITRAEGGEIRISGNAGAWFGEARAACTAWIQLADTVDADATPPHRARDDRDAQWLAVPVTYTP